MHRRDFYKMILTTLTTQAYLGVSLPALAKDPQPIKDIPQEGIEFITLSTQVPTELSSKNGFLVLNFFRYGCPHCFAFEPRFDAWAKKYQTPVVIRKTPTSFHEKMDGQQKAYFVFQELGLLDHLHQKLFEAIHKEKKTLESVESIIAWAVSQGAPKAGLEKSFESFSTTTKANQAKNLQRSYNIQGTPSIGINGKYYTDGSLAGSNEKALHIVDYLINQRKS
ncbi:MAG: thiol:disulfide interchange protein DsbA/DsbL [Gammaproteobacteria bacterium]|nr:thiol:disulfide interchange protein DsbA/DsbL [Gammaproteobacteria bacterium]